MESTKNTSLKTVLTISVGFGFIFLCFDFKWAFYLSLSIGLLGVVSNRAASTIEFVWMKMAKILSFIVPNILLSAIFYLFLFPVAVLSKVFGNKNALQLKNENETLWVNRNTQIIKESFEKMW